MKAEFRFVMLLGRINEHVCVFCKVRGNGNLLFMLAQTNPFYNIDLGIKFFPPHNEELAKNCLPLCNPWYIARPDWSGAGMNMGVTLKILGVINKIGGLIYPP